MASCARAVTICQVGRRATNLAKGARASAPAETTLRLTPLHRRSHWSATSTPQKDLKPILVTRSHCGQDGRAPNLPKGVESKVGRAVQCAPLWVVLTRLSRARIPPSAPLRARLRRATLPVEKKPVPRSTQLEVAPAKMAARQICPKAQ